jgi:hypothetical protein
VRPPNFFLVRQLFRFPPKASFLTSKRKGRRQKLPFSFGANVKAAQITPAAVLFDSVQLFEPQRWSELARFKPGVLIGCWRDLHVLAEQVALGKLELATVDHAVFVLTDWGSTPLNDTVRVILWQAFGVPVYELLVGTTGMLLAAECEAHEGWHIQPGATFSAIEHKFAVNSAKSDSSSLTLNGYIEHEPCACGRPGDRIMVGETTSSAQLRVLAAIA